MSASPASVRRRAPDAASAGAAAPSQAHGGALPALTGAVLSAVLMLGGCKPDAPIADRGDTASTSAVQSDCQLRCEGAIETCYRDVCWARWGQREADAPNEDERRQVVEDMVSCREACAFHREDCIAQCKTQGGATPASAAP